MRSSGLSSLLHNALKASTSLQHAMLTGIQRGEGEHVQQLINLVVCTVKDREYAQYSASPKKTKTMLEYYGLS
ncbi:MAG: hypothetical protein V8T10_08595 [Merdibacter sp.]